MYANACNGEERREIQNGSSYWKGCDNIGFDKMPVKSVFPGHS